MKKTGMFLMMTAITYAVSAQDMNTFGPHETDLSQQTFTPVANSFETEGMNFLKWNVSSLIAKNISLQYERVINGRISLAMGLRLMPQSGIPFRGTLEDIAADDNPEGRSLIHEALVGGFAITPELRYYLGSGYGKGFYLAPFVRYEHINIETTYNFTAPDNSVQRIGFDGSNTAWGFGLLIGSQFRLSNHIYLDWWIAGPYYNHHNLNLNAGGFAISNEESTLLNKELDKIELLNLDVQTQATNTAASLKASGGLAALRGLGLCLSFRL